MNHGMHICPDGITPFARIALHSGTNGYLSTWGPILAGTSPFRFDA